MAFLNGGIAVLSTGGATLLSASDGSVISELPHKNVCTLGTMLTEGGSGEVGV